MRRRYDRDGHRLYGKGSEVPFAEYLEHFSRFGPEERDGERRMIIEKLKDGIREAEVEDTT